MNSVGLPHCMRAMRGNRNKQAIEALIRSLPERSLRMQIRFEITEGVGDLLDRHNRDPDIIYRMRCTEGLIIYVRRHILARCFISGLCFSGVVAVWASENGFKTRCQGCGMKSRGEIAIHNMAIFKNTLVRK